MRHFCKLSALSVFLCDIGFFVAVRFPASTGMSARPILPRKRSTIFARASVSPKPVVTPRICSSGLFTANASANASSTSSPISGINNDLLRNAGSRASPRTGKRQHAHARTHTRFQPSRPRPRHSCPRSPIDCDLPQLRPTTITEIPACVEGVSPDRIRLRTAIPVRYVPLLALTLLRSDCR